MVTRPEEPSAARSRAPAARAETRGDDRNRASMDELTSTTDRYHRRRRLPDPDPRPIRHMIVSVDDHLLEAPDTFVTRVDQRLRDAAPRIVEHDGGHAWLVDGSLISVSSANAPVSWPPTDREPGPVRLEDVRQGAWDVNARLRDMDVDGVWASLCFPSMTFGFAGQGFLRFRDARLGRACVRAYNDWVLEEVVAPFPQRFIPCQIAWLADVDEAAADVRRKAERGFKAVSFSENPERLGLPSLHSGHWDPLFRACAETGTVINIHAGSSSYVVRPSSDSPTEVLNMALTVNPILAAYDWLFSGIPQRFPDVRIVLSEGGIDWVPMVLSRLESAWRQHPTARSWVGDLSPRDVLLRNFWFSALWDAYAYEVMDDIGCDRVVLETDYPHADSTWPDSQRWVSERLAGLSDASIRSITHETAARLYGHPLPREPLVRRDT